MGLNLNKPAPASKRRPGFRLVSAALCTLLLGLGAESACRADSLRFEEDKQKHFFVSLALGAASAAAAREHGADGCRAAGIGITFTMTIGAGKEYYDRRYKDSHRWSWQDLVWDFAGAALGSALAGGCY